ncbi:MAG: DUF4405 domain-containing protein [Selenomonadaceae bacterium]|nr:DUF4405 domain-containing protein [Selenomonadaceae bacterium]
MKKNFWLDVILFVSGIICIVTGIILDFHLVEGGREVRRVYRLVHTYSGYVMAVGILIHLAWHVDWIKNAARKIFRRN